MKQFAAALACLALFGCGSRTETVAVATIIDVYEDKAPMGCMGTDWNTIVKTEDKRVARLCGKFGQIGDTIRGCWYVDNRDPFGVARTGFSTSCEK